MKLIDVLKEMERGQGQDWAVSMSLRPENVQSSSVSLSESKASLDLKGILEGIGRFLWGLTPMGFGQWLERKKIPLPQETKETAKKEQPKKQGKTQERVQSSPKPSSKAKKPSSEVEPPKEVLSQTEQIIQDSKAREYLQEAIKKILKTYDTLAKQIPDEEKRLEEMRKRVVSGYDKINVALKEMPKLDLSGFVYPTIPEKIDSYQKLSAHAKLLVGVLTLAFAVKGIKEGIPNAAASFFNSVIEAYRKKDEEEYQEALDKYREELQKLQWKFQKKIAEYQQKFHEWQMTRYEPLKLELERDLWEYQNALAGYQLTIQALQHLDNQLVNLIGKELQAEDLQRKILETLAKIEEIYKGKIPREQAQAKYYRERAKEVGKKKTIELPENLLKEIEKQIREEEEE